MSHSKSIIWIHTIWSTKNREPLIESKIELELFRYISEEFYKLGCRVKNINGMSDHIHCLFLLSQNQSIASVIKQIKGSSSHWVNQNSLISKKFSWQTGYAAYSVSESIKDKVDKYINNQKEHHKTKTFTEEYEEFLAIHGLENG
ncbi:MAG: IS200/IS605 family transposase [Balneola sp.]